VRMEGADEGTGQVVLSGEASARFRGRGRRQKGEKGRNHPTCTQELTRGGKKNGMD